MSLLVEIAPILISGFVGVVAGFVGRHFKEVLQRKHKDEEPLRYGIVGSNSIEVPSAKDWASLQQRLSALHQISPTLAVLDGWTLVEAAIKSRQQKFGAFGQDSYQDPLTALSILPNMSDDLKEEISKLRRVRNLVAHAQVGPNDLAAESAANSVLSILERLGERRPLNSDA